MFPEVKGGRCVGLTTLPSHVLIVLKSESLNLLEPYGPAQACNGIALLYFCPLLLNIDFKYPYIVLYCINNEKTLLLFGLMLCFADDDSSCRKGSKDKMYNV